MADKFEGRVHQPPARAVTLALHEPVGVIGIVAPDDAPLLGFISLVAPALAMGNTVVAVPSQRYPLLATDLYQVIEYSDVPAGAINIVTGKTAELAGVLAKHDDVDGFWVVADADICKMAEAQSIGNLKRVWTSNGRSLDWTFGRSGWGHLPAPGDRGEERLGALRRLRRTFLEIAALWKAGPRASGRDRCGRKNPRPVRPCRRHRRRCAGARGAEEARQDRSDRRCRW